MKVLSKAILPLGFKAGGTSCGLKKSGNADLALIFTDVPAVASCLFTTNKIIAAPVVLCKEYLRKNKAFHVILANSGNANCFTGKEGLKDAEKTAKAAAAALTVKPESVLVF